MKPVRRSKSLQIYLKPGIREDDILLEVWEACVQFDRNQDVFRSILRHGLLSMLESGLMPEAVVDACDLERLIERRKRNKGRRMPETHLPPHTYPITYPHQERHYYGQEEQYYRPPVQYPAHQMPLEDERYISRHQKPVPQPDARYHDAQQHAVQREPLNRPADLSGRDDAMRSLESAPAPTVDAQPGNSRLEGQEPTRDDTPQGGARNQSQPASKANNDRPKKLGNLM